MKLDLILVTFRLVNKYFVCTVQSSYGEEIIMSGVTATGVCEVPGRQAIPTCIFRVILKKLMNLKLTN
jgi:hypothetical protein